MKHFLARIFCYLGIILSLSTCGGGGGGGSDSSNDSNAQTGIRLLHGALEVSPLSLETTTDRESNPIDEVSFLDATFFKELPDGRQTLRLFERSNPDNLVFNSSIVVEDRARWDLVIFGNLGERGLRTRLLEESRPEDFQSDRAYVRVIHAVDRASALTVRMNNQIIGAPVGFGNASNYQEVSPGQTVRFSISRTVDSQLLTQGTVSLEPGQFYTLFAGGEVDFFVRSLLLADSK